MKIVDLADEIHRELGSPSDLSIPAIAFYVRTNIGALNNHLNTSFDVDSTSFEIEESGTAITPEEVAIMKKMYLVHYYDGKLRDTINAATSDAVIALSSDGSSARSPSCTICFLTSPCSLALAGEIRVESLFPRRC